MRGLEEKKKLKKREKRIKRKVKRLEKVKLEEEKIKELGVNSRIRVQVEDNKNTRRECPCRKCNRTVVKAKVSTDFWPDRVDTKTKATIQQKNKIRKIKQRIQIPTTSDGRSGTTTEPSAGCSETC